VSTTAWPSHFLLRAYVNQPRVVSLTQIVEHPSFVQVTKLGHVFALLKLGRIHFLRLFFLDGKLDAERVGVRKHKGKHV
jgi:hypothetical protein